MGLSEKSHNQVTKWSHVKQTIKFFRSENKVLLKYKIPKHKNKTKSKNKNKEQNKIKQKSHFVLKTYIIKSEILEFIRNNAKKISETFISLVISC